MVVPCSLLEVACTPLGHGPQREDGNDSDTTGCQDRSEDPMDPVRAVHPSAHWRLVTA